MGGPWHGGGEARLPPRCCVFIALSRTVQEGRKGSSEEMPRRVKQLNRMRRVSQYRLPLSVRGLASFPGARVWEVMRPSCPPAFDASPLSVAPCAPSLAPGFLQAHVSPHSTL